MKPAACSSQALQAAEMIPRGFAPESDPPLTSLPGSLSSLLGEPLTSPSSLSAREANWNYLAVHPVLIPLREILH